MKTLIRQYLYTLAALLVLDGLWLSTTSQSFYAPRLAHLTGPVQIGPAVFFYVLYAAVVTGLVVRNSIRERHPILHALRFGALLGLGAYGAYDLTNQATLRDWPLVLTVVDMAWGAFVTAVGAAVGTALARRHR